MSYRILINDYGGYYFITELGMKLASRGHQVHIVFNGYERISKINSIYKSETLENYSITGLYTEQPIEKFNFIKRRKQEIEYGKLVIDEIKHHKPELILSANAPLDAQARVLKHCSRNGIKFIFWLHDLIGIAIKRILQKKVLILGSLIGGYYILLEKSLLKKSDHIISITKDFTQHLDNLGINESKVTIIQNWASLTNISPQPKQNRWSQKQCLEDKFCFMYTGTLGMKHNPNVFIKLAEEFRNNENVKVVVVSEGPIADWLEDRKSETNLRNLILLPFQPFEDLPDVLGSADVLLALLEEDAGTFSVPSKVLTYLCAKRPLLLAVPRENLAARIVTRNKAGIVVSPGDQNLFIEKAKELYTDPKKRIVFAKNGREYAERIFDIEKIADRFENIIHNTIRQE